MQVGVELALEINDSNQQDEDNSFLFVDYEQGDIEVL